MNPELFNTLVLAALFLLLFAAAEGLHHLVALPAELTRKIVHLLTGVLAMSFPLLLKDHRYVLALCGSFLVLLLLSLRWGKLRSINGVDRSTRGSLVYPVVVYGCYLLHRHHGAYVFYYLPIMVLAVCDPVAAFVGMRWPRGRFLVFGGAKTLSGSLAFLAVAIVLGVLLFRMAEEAPLREALVLACTVGLATTLAEAVTHRGYDNLTIPAAAALVLTLGRSAFSFF